MIPETEENPSSNNEVVNESPETSVDTPGSNPSWSEVLSIIPAEFHPQITPHFQKWDQAAQSRIESVNSKYADYAPFVEHGISRDDLVNGLQLLHTINNDPKAVYDALVEQHGFTPQQAKEAVENAIEGEEEENNLDPRFSKLEAGFNTLAEYVLKEQDTKRQQEADAQVEKDFEEARKKYGDFDEQFVIDRLITRAEAGQDYTIDEAVQDYKNLVNNIITQHQQPYAPNVLGATSGGGSGMPSQAVDVNNLSDGEAKNLVVEMLRRANQR